MPLVVGLIAWGESTTPTYENFVLSLVSLALRDPHPHLRWHGKIRDCEQSSQLAMTLGDMPKPHTDIMKKLND